MVKEDDTKGGKKNQQYFPDATVQEYLSHPECIPAYIDPILGKQNKVHRGKKKKALPRD